MIAFSLEDMIRERIAENIQLEQLSDKRVVVYMPFMYDDGDQCSIYLTRRGKSSWQLTDDGDACKRAHELGFDHSKKGNSERLQSLVELYGVSEKKGELRITTKNDQIADSLFALTQACLETTWLAKAGSGRA